jgi:hypothetical protein
MVRLLRWSILPPSDTCDALGDEIIRLINGNMPTAVYTHAKFQAHISLVASLIVVLGTRSRFSPSLDSEGVK